MKKLTLVLAAIFMSIGLISQTPQAFKYQAVVRNDLGQVINNQTVSFRISIHDSIATGSVVFQETHIVMTDAYGHANLEIGTGTQVTGTISDIDWNDDDKYLEVELDPLGNTAYVSMGTTQLLAVPYALYSESTGDTTKWRKIEDNLYFDGGTVSIGTSTPSSWAKLDVRGNFGLDGYPVIYRTDGNDAAIDLYNQTSDWEMVAASDANRFDIRKWGDIPALSISENYNIGLRTTNPVVDLDIRSVAPDLGSRILLGNGDNSSNIFLHGGTDTGNPYISYKGGDALRFVRYDGGLNELMRLQSDGKVAIGTDSAYTGLHLKGDGWPNSFLALQSDKGNDAGIRFYEGDTAKWHIFNNANDSGLIIYNFNGQKVTYFADQETGNVGIGTVNPLNKLHIQDVDISLKEPDLLNEIIVVEDLDAGMGLYSLNDGGYGSVISMGEIAAGNLNNKWSIFRTTSIHNGFENQLRFSYGTDPSYAVNPTFLTIDSSGNVGIGTTTPTEMLEVADTIYSSVGGFKFPDGSVQVIAAGYGGVISINNLTNGKTNPGSVFLGQYAGENDDAGYNENTAVGHQALRENTSGNNNTATGAIALYSNTTGLYNTATGSNALLYNTTGDANIAIGCGAHFSNTLGDYNVSLGHFANGYNETGSRNTMIGSRAGTGTSLHTKNGNVFLGYQAGYYETGDNKLYIENSDTTAPLIGGDFSLDEIYFNGNVGIGTTSPTTNLHVNGTDGALFEGTFGSGTLSTTGSGTRLMWYPAKAAFRAGYISGTQWDDANIGDFSIALGRNTTASGNHSMAMGSYVTVLEDGAFAIGDHSTTNTTTYTYANSFNARFANGFRLYTVSGSPWVGASLVAGANSWGIMSDSTKKENFQLVNSEDILSKIGQFKLGTWNYIGQDSKSFRHYGPMAQDFYAAFGNDGIGTIGSDTTLSSADFVGINFIAIQALEKRTSELMELKSELEALKEENMKMEQQLADITKDIELIKSMAQMNTLTE